MKIKNLVSLSFLLALFTCSQSYAYNIYNSLGYTINVLDGKSSGLNQTIANGNYASCNPTSTGCNGNMKLVVYLEYGKPSAVLCRWNGQIGTDPGHYFIITKADDAPCKITHYHD